MNVGKGDLGSFSRGIDLSSTGVWTLSKRSKHTEVRMLFLPFKERTFLIFVDMISVKEIVISGVRSKMKRLPSTRFIKFHSTRAQLLPSEFKVWCVVRRVFKISVKSIPSTASAFRETSRTHSPKDLFSKDCRIDYNSTCFLLRRWDSQYR